MRPVAGVLGEALSIKLEQFNILRGTITRLFPAGFDAKFDASSDERTEIAAKIDWIKKRRFRSFKDKRQQKRVNPPSPRSAITMADGSVKECFVIDVSPGRELRCLLMYDHLTESVWRLAG